MESGKKYTYSDKIHWFRRKSKTYYHSLRSITYPVSSFIRYLTIANYKKISGRYVVGQTEAKIQIDIPNILHGISIYKSFRLCIDIVKYK